MFLDEAIIEVCAGKGGDGIVAFRREKYVPRGGPAGGDGGRGGSVLLVVDPRLNTLVEFQHKRRLTAEDGHAGRGKNQTGADGADLLVPVPPGTLVRDAETGALLADLIDPGRHVCVARGGRGGRGNARFANSRHQTPRIAEKGDPGETRRLKLELKLIADIGVIGVPNAGKSTLLAAISNARPKIADYPFTTLQPNLGVVTLEDVTLVVADIPGLIAGASQGAGLGDAFLRHIERTRVLIHLLDGAAADPLADYATINSELALFNPRLAAKPQLVALNKLDLPMAVDRWPSIRAALAAQGHDALAISAVSGQGVREMLFRAARLAAEAPPEPEPEIETLDVLPAGGESVNIAHDVDGSWHVRGAQIEKLARRVYWEEEEAVNRFQSTIERLGVRRALEDAGVKEGDTVFIGDVELEWRD
jgi:GTP-binding protein